MPQEENTVFVGNKKPTINYVLACMTLFANSKKIVLKARGRAISKAVDVTEILRRRFVTEAKVSSVQIGTEELTDAETKRTSRVSSIEITLTKK